MEKREETNIVKVILPIVMILLLSSFALAGVGIKFERESSLVNEGEKTCLTYSVYNPWPTASYVQIALSDELKNVLTMQEVETKLIPAETSSSEAIPVEFCFKSPKIYERDCWIGDSFICKQDCNEEMVEYSGEVIVETVPKPAESGGAGGSATAMSVSAPLKLRIKCNPHSRDFTLIYVIVALISAIVIATILYKRYRKPKFERDRERLKRLKEELKRESKNR